MDRGSHSLNKKWLPGLRLWETRGMTPVATELVLLPTLVDSFWSAADQTAERLRFDRVQRR